MLIAYNTHHKYSPSMMYFKNLVQSVACTIYILLCVCATVTISAQSPGTISLSGLVTDIAGSPLPGVNVTVNDLSSGTITDTEGRYTLVVPDSAVLTFSFTGYESLVVPIDGRSTIDVLLKESAEILGEVVVIGYGITTKKEVTGAVTSIKSEDFNKGTYTDPMGLIQGKVAGLSITKPNGGDPLSGYQILLRGTNTLTSGQEPLIIIDGVIGADLRNINFQDVESFDVLKDGSAAAIYGTRGTNGVIIITTKGARSGKSTFEFSSQFTAQVSPRGVENLTADEFEDAILTYTPSKAGSLFGSKTDWFDEITREVPFSQQQHMALSGGGEKFSHRTSLTYSTDQGLLQENSTQRILFKTNLRQKVLNDRLTLDFNLATNLRDYKPANYDLFRQAFIQNPTQPVYDDSDPETGGYSYKQGLEYYNPVALLNERTREGSTNDIVQNLRATLKILDNLSWDNFVSSQKSDWEEGSYKTRYYPTILGVGGEAEIANGRSTNSQFESVLNYNTSVNDHHFQGVAGYSYQAFEQNSSYTGNSDFDTDIFLYNNIAAGAFFSEGKGDLGSYKESSTLIAMFGRVMYNYREKYLASVSLRREGSSKFGDNNKWGWFPAVSVGWRLHEEDFMQDVNWIDDLKFRVGYGETGNQDFSSYQSLILLERVGSLYYNQEWINSYGPGQNPNPDLRWEKKKELNIGLDFTMSNHKINGSLEFYVRKSEDLLWEFQVSVPPYLYPFLFTNVGTISNRGVELTLNTQLMKRENFRWNTTFIASHNTNKLDKITNDEFTQSSYETAFIGGTIGVWTQRIEEGKELGTFYGPVWLGVSEEGFDQFKNQNPIGEVDKSDWEDIGSANPIAMLGWSNTMSFKRFDFSFNFRAGIGGKVLNTYRLYYESWQSIGLRNIVHTQYENPEFIGNITYSSKYVEDATFLKLDNLTLNYNFNIKSRYVSGLGMYASAQNVWWITGYQGIDPEVNLSGLEPGIDRLSYYPRTTSLTLGLNATF
jgi:TonB-dependent starch-binding outer membrane protein SusC